MELLLTESDIRQRMSTPDNATLSPSVLSVAGSAQAQIESLLGVKFDFQQLITDIFYVDVGFYWRTLPNDLASLLLRTGFVDPASIVLRKFSSIEAAMDVNVVGEAVPAQRWSASDANLVAGVIKVNANYYDQTCITVTYSAGFENADDENIPDWVKEAILTRAQAMLSTTVPTGDTVAALQLYQELSRQIDTMVAPYARKNIPFSYKPVFA